MTRETSQTRPHRLNEPAWEPRKIRWINPDIGANPESGLFWFFGSVKLGPENEIFGKFAIWVQDDWAMGLVGYQFPDFQDAGFHARLRDMDGEWYGPLECPPWLGEAMLESVETAEEGEHGEGI